MVPVTAGSEFGLSQGWGGEEGQHTPGTPVKWFLFLWCPALSPLFPIHLLSANRLSMAPVRPTVPVPGVQTVFLTQLARL